MARTILILGVLLACLALGGCGGFWGCIVEGTPIATPTGPSPIESIRAGDEVYSLHGSGEVGVSRVTRTWTHIAPEHLAITLDDGRVLRATAEHPIAIGGSFVPAGHLVVGDAVRLSDTSMNIIGIEVMRQTARVFDLAVEPGDSFFASGVLVHNKTVPASAPLALSFGDYVGVTSRGEIITLRCNANGAILGRGWAFISTRAESERTASATGSVYVTDGWVPSGEREFNATFVWQPPEVDYAYRHPPPIRTHVCLDGCGRAFLTLPVSVPGRSNNTRTEKIELRRRDMFDASLELLPTLSPSPTQASSDAR